jgi:hypothetical protein
MESRGEEAISVDLKALVQATGGKGFRSDFFDNPFHGSTQTLSKQFLEGIALVEYPVRQESNLDLQVGHTRTSFFFGTLGCHYSGS